MKDTRVGIAEKAVRRVRIEFEFRYQARENQRQGADALEEQVIAELPDATITQMTRDELVRVICAGGLPLSPGFDAERLRMQDQGMLERLAFLARHACRNRVRRQPPSFECGWHDHEV